jgi:hypothetical protein
MSATQAIYVLGRKIMIDLPTNNLQIQSCLESLAKKLNNFIEDKVPYGKFAKCNELASYFMMRYGSPLDKEMCELDDSYSTLRSEGNIDTMIAYRGFSCNQEQIVLKDYYCTIDEFKHYECIDRLILDDTIPIYKLMLLLITAVNKEFDGVLVLRVADTEDRSERLYVFRPPSSRIFHSLKQSDINDTEVIIKMFQQNIRDEIKKILVRAKFSAMETLGLLNDQDRFLERLAGLFSGLENVPRHILITWGPGGIGDVSDFTVQPCGDAVRQLVYRGNIDRKSPDLVLSVSSIYATAHKLSMGKELTLDDLNGVRHELNLSDAPSNCVIQTVINVCLTRFKLISAESGKDEQ